MDWTAVDWTALERGVLGGLLIGVSASALLLLNGRIAGITGILDGVLYPGRDEWGWRPVFLAGLLAGGAAMLLADRAMFGDVPGRSLPAMLAAGLLVGFGTRLANGCTSGHGVCGIARLSPRSLVATGVFIVTGALTVYGIHLLGGSL